MIPFIAYHPAFCHPLPEGHRFPMIKYDLLPKQLLHEGIVDEDAFFQPKLVNEESILAVHDSQYWNRLKALQLDKNEIRRTGFPLSQTLVEREMYIDEGTIQSAVAALEIGIGFNIAGGTHHAGSNWGEGFCLLNDHAIGAKYLVEKKGIKRVLIVDLDVHQGNGTAECLQNENRVFTFSMHGTKNFPFHKEISDLDIGLADYTAGEEYLQILDDTLKKLFREVDPEFVFFQAGCDVLASDKLGRMSLTQEDCQQRDRLVFEYCKRNNTPVQVSMGGGYSEDIRHIIDAHTNTYREGIELILG